MQWKPALCAFVVLAVALAGCSDGKSGNPTDEAEFEGPELTATADTGIIRGTVVDDAIRPIQGALIQVKGAGVDKNTTSTASGTWGFDGLEPGTYFVSASKLGYAPQQTSVDVVAGVKEPALTKILMPIDAESMPSFQVIPFNGFIECSVLAGRPNTLGGGGFFMPCYLPLVGPIGNDNSFVEGELPGSPDYIHVSMEWDATQDFGRNLYANLYEPNTYNIVAWNGSASPLVINANATTIAPLIESGMYAVEVATDGESTADGAAGASFQQDFNMYIVLFYNFEPPEDYAYHKDGDPIVPS